MKKVLVFNFVILCLSFLISWLFPLFGSYWIMITVLLFLGLSLFSHFLYKFLSLEGNITAPFFLSMTLRFLSVGIMTLFYVKVRNIPTLNYVEIIFIVYLCHLVFELKHIIHNLRDN